MRTTELELPVARSAAQGVSTFRRSLPVTLTSFINKAGTIGLSIVPVILVERHVSSLGSAWIMGSIKSASLLGILLGGWFCDRLGLRITLLLSFAISGIGLAPLPFVKSAIVLAVLAFIAQLGTSFYYASARLLITQIVPAHEHREAIAWQRTANNFAQIISYSLGAALSGFGTTALILFDSITSFLAVAVGYRILPSGSRIEPNSTNSEGKPRSLTHFLQGALAIASFSFLYDLYTVAAAAKCRILFGVNGLAVFSEIMIINTVLCAAFSVIAARHIRKAEIALPSGLILATLGLLLTFSGAEQRLLFFLGSFVLTLGEIVFSALAGLVLIYITPAGKNQASLYSGGVLFQFMGRILGATLAFPLVINSNHPLEFIAGACFVSLALCLSSWKILRDI